MGSHQPGAMISDWEPAVGDTASLHADGVTIFTRITSAIDRQYKAEIIGFEGWDDEYFKARIDGRGCPLVPYRLSDDQNRCTRSCLLAGKRTPQIVQDKVRDTCLANDTRPGLLGACEMAGSAPG